MGACFGPGIISSIPCDRVETLAQKLEILEALAAAGVAWRFREIIDGRVIELSYDEHVGVESRWLDEAEAAPVIEICKGKGGSAPYSSLDPFEGYHVLVPERRHGARRLEFEPLEGWGVSGYEGAITSAERAAAEAEDEWDARFFRHIAEELRATEAAGLIWVFGW